jgi:DNA ligase-1
VAGTGRRRNRPNATAATASVRRSVATLATIASRALPGDLAGWLDALDETGRWALPEADHRRRLRIGVSARLAKTAVASARRRRDADEVEHSSGTGSSRPMTELFAWVEGRARGPRRAIRAVPAADARASARGRRSRRADPDEFAAEWKWDGIRVQAVAEPTPTGDGARLYLAHRRGHWRAFPDLVAARWTSTA